VSLRKIKDISGIELLFGYSGYLYAGSVMCKNFASERKIEHAIVELPEKAPIKVIAEIILPAMDIDAFQLARSGIFRFFHAFPLR